MQTIIPFNTEKNPRQDEAGGKALRLIESTRAGLPVPPGFVLTTAFFEAWMNELKNSAAWSGLNDPSPEKTGPTVMALQQACKSLRLNTKQNIEMGKALEGLGRGRAAPASLLASAGRARPDARWH